ncbi:MAG: PspC domain-containing protein [Chloroflexi bacterium]|nr:PspC domain-containing protein [Chloroflexota bacterium]
MRRSFSDRVIGGVCGGLAGALHLDSWLIRGLFALLTVISLGIFGILYVLLWWIVPMESPLERRRGLPLLLVILLVALSVAAWYARDQNLITAPDGSPLFWQGAALVLAAVFLLRQIR